MLDSPFRMQTMNRNRFKFVFLLACLMCLIATSFGELKKNRFSETKSIFNEETNNFEYETQERRGSSNYKEVDKQEEKRSIRKDSEEIIKDYVVDQENGDYKRAQNGGVCDAGGVGTEECNKYGKKCVKSTSNSKGYRCGLCLKETYTENDDKYCVESCSVGTKKFRTCEKENRKCKRLTEYPYAKCDECKDGYVTKKSFWGDNCVELCSTGTVSAKNCNSLKKNCHVTKQEPFFECRCKDNLTEKNGKCIEHCIDGTESKDKCNKQKKECKKLEKKPFYECGKCQEKFEKKNDNCVDFCTAGTASEIKCSALNKTCKSKTTKPFFDCPKCKTGYEQVGNVCSEYCANGTKGEEECSSVNKICEKTNDKYFFKCTECLEGYILEGDKCVKYCDNGTEEKTNCSRQHKQCYVTQKYPFYYCENCLDKFTNKGDECVEYCSVDTVSRNNCSQSNRKCKKEDRSPYFNCGECVDGFLEVDDICVAQCSNGTESEKNCTALNRTCEVTHKTNFFCGKCKTGYVEKNGECLDYCTEGERGHTLCRRQNRDCTKSEDGLFYKCTECIIGYILNGEYCVDPCEEGEKGQTNCSALGRSCIFNPGEEYRCGACNDSDWIEDGYRCIDPCEHVFSSEENITWSAVCENANASCIHNRDFNKTTCVCHEKDNVFNRESKSCLLPCNDVFEKGENATWSEVCENINATCEHNQILNKTNCICQEENSVFNKSSKSCINLCSIEIDGIIWSDLCRETNATCILKKNKESVTCECIQPEIFDDHSKTCKGPCDLPFSDNDNRTWSEVCTVASAICEYNLDNTVCKCSEKHTVFNVTTKSCIKLHPCDRLDEYPCKNNGTCEKIDEESYTCNCSSAWYGKYCEHQSLCTESLCYPAKCVMSEKYHSYMCVCKEDEYYNYEKKSCEKIACLGKTCSAFRECQNGSCICKQGFVDDNGDCKMTDEKCEELCGMENVACVNISSPTEFTCRCKEGYYLNQTSFFCEASRCIYPFHPCEQQCNTDGDELCSCFDGFRLVDNYSCEAEPRNSCNESVCKNGKCLKRNGTEECVCNNGFMALNGSQCIDICEIDNSELTQSLCPNDCKHENGRMECICKGKYIQAADGITCVERDYCQEGNIGQTECSEIGKICIKHDQDPWYRCVCPKGLRKKDDGSCTDFCSDEKIKDCALKLQTCRYINQTEECQCPLSMVSSEKYDRCQFADNFFHVTVDVRTEQTDKNIMYAMHEEEDFKNSIPTAMQLLYGPSLLTTDVIECRNKEDIQECTFSMIFEKNATGIINRLKDEKSCIPYQNTTEYCIFPPNLIVVRSSLENATLSRDKCDKKIRKKFCPDDSNICTSLLPGYSCLCKSGFYSIHNFTAGNDDKYKYQACGDIDECETNPCWKNSKCENVYGSYQCNCKTGYVLNVAKNGCKGVCDDNPCGNNGECKQFGDHGYKCKCNQGFVGETCMEKYESVYVKQYNTYKIVIGASLGSVLLLSLLVIMAMAIKLYRSYRSSYCLEMSYCQNKYELAPWLQVTEGAINKEKCVKTIDEKKNP